MPPPSVEIIVVKYGKPDLEERCIGSIRRCTDLGRHKLTAFDNFERDIQLGALWNRLIAESDADWICLLNPDTEVQPKWLDGLLEAGESADAAGPLTNKCGIGQQVAQGPRDAPPFEAKTLSGFCLLLRRTAWERAGGFREDLHPYGQETNLLDRLKGRMVVQPKVFVKHVAGAYFKSQPGRDLETERKAAARSYLKNRAFDWRTRALFIGSGERGTPMPLFRGIEQAVREFSRQGMAVRYVSAGDIEKSWRDWADWRPHVTVLVNTNPTRLAAAIRRLPNLPGRKALWFNDLRGPCPQLNGASKAFDRIFLCWEGHRGEFSHGRWQSVSGIRPGYMPQGSILNPELPTYREARLAAFIGSTLENWAHKGRAATCRGLGAEVFNGRRRESRLSLERKSGAIYRSSRYCLSMSLPVPGYGSIRQYNIMAHGGLLLLKRFPGAERLFNHGANALLWGNASEARSLMEGGGDLEAIRRNGWRLQQTVHNVPFRLLNIMHNTLTGEDGFWGFL